MSGSANPQRTGRRSRQRMLLGLALLCACVWLLGRVLEGPPTGDVASSGPRSAATSAEGVTLQVGSPADEPWAAHSTAQGSVPPSAPSSRSDALVVRVRADGLPRPEAMVALSLPNPAAEALGLTSWEDMLEVGRTDHEGIARVARDANKLMGATIVMLSAAAQGFARACVTVPADAADVTIDLQRGLQISGVVETISGRPVPGLWLECLPWGHAGNRSSWRDGYDLASLQGALTDDRGAFTVPGLAPGRYALRSRAGDVQLRTRDRDPRGGGLMRFGLPVMAGGPQLRLVAEHLGLVFLRCVDAETGQGLPLVAIPGNVQFRAPAVRVQAMQREAFELHLPGGAYDSVFSGPYPSDGATSMLAVLVADEEAVFLDGVDAFVEMEGFLPVQQRAQVSPLGSHFTSLKINEIRVQAEHDHGSLACSVRTHEPPPSQGSRRGALRIARFTMGSGVSVLRRGRLEEPGVWLFSGLPAGAGTVEVGDGGQNRAQRAHVTLTAGRVEDLDVSYQGSASFAIQVVDREGHEIMGLSLGCTPLSPPGQGVGLIDDMGRPSLAPSGRTLERLCMQLAAGEYRFSASSYDIGAGSADVRLENDKFSLVRIVLTTPPSALRGPPR